jgi:hypothetical protein
MANITDENEKDRIFSELLDQKLYDGGPMYLSPERAQRAIARSINKMWDIINKAKGANKP